VKEEEKKTIEVYSIVVVIEGDYSGNVGLLWKM
jgi:hypothetical protein